MPGSTMPGDSPKEYMEGGEAKQVQGATRVSSTGAFVVVGVYFAFEAVPSAGLVPISMFSLAARTRG